MSAHSRPSRWPSLDWGSCTGKERERGGALTYRESPETCFFFCVCVSVDLGGNIKWWFRLEAKDSGRQRTYCRANKLLVKWRNERDNEPDLFLRPLGIFSMPASWRKSTPGLLGNNINFTFKKKTLYFGLRMTTEISRPRPRNGWIWRPSHVSWPTVNATSSTGTRPEE